MEIISFSAEPGDEFMVTLHMRDMPKEARGHNTTVYIGGVPQGNPAISFSRQEIVFRAARDVEAGPISVMTYGSLTATSAENYQPPAPEPEHERPVVTGISQPDALPGDIRTLRGQNLGKITGVGLQAAVGFYTAINVRAQDTFVTFTVPSTALPSEEPYPVFIRSSSYPSFVRTPVRLKVVKDY